MLRSFFLTRTNEFGSVSSTLLRMTGRRALTFRTPRAGGCRFGHERCGAVVAACDVATKNTKLPGSIGPMVKPIVPAAMAMKGKPGDFVDNTVRESAKRTAARLATSPILSHLLKGEKLKIVAARYDLDDGKVEYLT